MKIAFWFVGASCAGKSYYAAKVAERLNCRWISLDTINDRMEIDGMSRDRGYEKLFEKACDVIVVDGIIPFNFPIDMDMVSKRLTGYNIIFVLVNPLYRKWLENRELRKAGISSSNPVEMTAEEYNEYNDRFGKRIERYLSIVIESDLDIISQEQIRNLNYQHPGFTDVKFKQLAIDCQGRSVLDLGCSSCQYEPLFFEAGASSYHGLDVNFAYLVRKNAELFDINKLDNYVGAYDIVVCTSVMHYIHDKEKFIRNCARLAKELVVLEIPLDRGEGKMLHLGSRGLYFPTKDLFEEWLGKYFKSFECKGESIVEDGSYRLIYHCKTI